MTPDEKINLRGQLVRLQGDYHYCMSRRAELLLMHESTIFIKQLLAGYEILCREHKRQMDLIKMALRRG